MIIQGYIYIWGGFHGHGATPRKIPSFEMDDDGGGVATWVNQPGAEAFVGSVKSEFRHALMRL